MVEQWVRICLSVKGTWKILLNVSARRFLTFVNWVFTAMQELGPLGCTYWACVPQLLKPMCPRARDCKKKRHHKEKPPVSHSQEQPLLTTGVTL